MRLAVRTRRRKGATLVEAALVLPVFLMLIVGMIDLGLGVLQAHVLSTAARQAARQAIVRGGLASGLGSWGPGEYGPVSLADSGAIAQAIRSYVPGIDPSTVTVDVQWLDGSNQPESRVRVTLTHAYQPITTYVVSGTIPLTASSTMRIAH